MIIVVLLLFFSIILVSIALQNTIYVPLRLLFWTVDASLAVYVIGAFTIGILAGLFLAIPNLVKKSIRLAGQNKSLSNLQKELDKVQENPGPTSSNLPSA